MSTSEDYVCAYCGRPAPGLDDRALLEWEGGEAVLAADPALVDEINLVCPACRGEEREREEGGGD